MLLLVLTIVSCGLKVTDLSGDDAGGGTGGVSDLQEYSLGDARKAERDIEGTERDLGDKICRSMENMRSRLTTGDSLNFKLTEKQCSGEDKFLDRGTAATVIVDRLGQPLELRATGSTSVFFPDLLTHTHILLSTVCSNITGGAKTTDTYDLSAGRRYQVRFRSRKDGEWLQIYEFNRSDKNEIIHSARIAIGSDNDGQAFFRQRTSACSGSTRVRQLIQELVL